MAIHIITSVLSYSCKGRGVLCQTVALYADVYGFVSVVVYVKR